MAALAVSGPFGAVKEQSSGLYAHDRMDKIPFDKSSELFWAERAPRVGWRVPG
jgi:hypothetical protein